MKREEVATNEGNYSNDAHQGEKRKYPKVQKRVWLSWLFCAVCLAYPIAQFVITWAYVNVDSVLLAFKQYYIWGDWSWAGFSQFASVIDDIFHSGANTTGVSWLNNTSVEILNSLGYGFVSIFISLPLSMVFAYFLSKKMPCSGVFRVIFFLPNIIPIVALVLAFKLPFDSSYGYLYKFLEFLGFDNATYFSSYPKAQIMVYVYCIWAGLGYNILLLSGAIQRIPKEILESAQLDGAGYFTEFRKIVVPLIWPTVVTLIVLGMSSVLTLYLQPYLLTGGEGNTYTIAMSIFVSTSSYNPVQYCEAAAKGLLFSMVWAPVVLIVRKLVSRRYSDVEY